MSGPSEKIASIARVVLAGGQIDRDEGLYLLRLEADQKSLYDLFYWSNRIRIDRFGADISLCSIASVRTGGCSEDCRFCAQSSCNPTQIEPNVLSDKQIRIAVEQACDCGVHYFGLVSSGRAAGNEDIKRITPVVESIVQSRQVQCCASMGLLDDRKAESLHKLGVRRYNHNLETSRRFFDKVVTTHTYDDRIDTVGVARKAGLRVCCGGIIGLGESLEDRIDLALAIRDLDVDGVPLNFLNPIPGTPLAGNRPVSPLVALQSIAVFRFILPDRRIIIAGGREDCLGDLQSWMFLAGASGTMTGNYLTTKGRAARRDIQMICDLKLPLATRLHIQHV